MRTHPRAGTDRFPAAAFAAAMLSCLAGGAVVAPLPALAQTATCPAQVLVGPGDTLSLIALRCGVPLAALVSANPQLPNIEQMTVGTVINIPPGFSSPLAPAPQPAPVQTPPAQTPPVVTQPAAEPYTQYTVRAGDTLSSIAQANGVALSAMLAANPNVDPRALRIGQVVFVPVGTAPAPQPAPQPAPVPSPSVAISPSSGAPGTVVTITAAGFLPASEVHVLAGYSSTSLVVVDTRTTDAMGRLSVTARVPEAARDGNTVYLTVETSEGRYRAPAAGFQVVVAAPVLSLQGTLTTDGGQCQAMRADDGAVYSLVGLLSGYVPGDRVAVEGRRIQSTVCTVGTAVEVTSIRRLAD